MMERVCGNLTVSVKSKLNPYGALTQRLIRTSQLNQLKVKYELGHELSLYKPLRDELIRGEAKFKECNVSQDATTSSVHRWTSISSCPATSVRAYLLQLSKRLMANSPLTNQLLPTIGNRWGGVRIVKTGHILRCSQRYTNTPNRTSRDSSFIRVRTLLSSDIAIAKIGLICKYKLLADENADDSEAPIILRDEVCYGELLDIFTFELQPPINFKISSPQWKVFAHVRPCPTFGKDASLEVVSYRTPAFNSQTPIIIPLDAIIGSIGMIKTKDNVWGIIDVV